MCDLGAVTSGPQSAVQRVIFLDSGPFWVMSVHSVTSLQLKIDINLEVYIKINVWKNSFQS